MITGGAKVFRELDLQELGWLNKHKKKSNYCLNLSKSNLTKDNEPNHMTELTGIESSHDGFVFILL